jgi:PEP-CTERM motif
MRKPSEYRSRVRLSMAFFVAAFLLLTVGTLQVSAQTTYTLSVPNSAVSGYPAPYGTVLVTLTSPTTATVTFTTSFANASNAYLMGDGGSADVNVNATSFTVTGISGTNSLPGFTPGSFTSAGSGNVDGFGTLNATINDFDGFTHSANVITFTLTDTSGTWANSGSVLVANSNGALAAIHLFVCNSGSATCNGTTSSAIATGFAANGGASQVPEPVSMLLFGSGLVAIGAKLRHHRKSQNPVAA